MKLGRRDWRSKERDWFGNMNVGQRISSPGPYSESCVWLVALSHRGSSLTTFEGFPKPQRMNRALGGWYCHILEEETGVQYKCSCLTNTLGRHRFDHSAFNSSLDLKLWFLFGCLDVPFPKPSLESRLFSFVWWPWQKGGGEAAGRLAEDCKDVLCRTEPLAFANAMSCDWCVGVDERDR